MFDGLRTYEQVAQPGFFVQEEGTMRVVGCKPDESREVVRMACAGPNILRTTFSI